MHLRCNECIEEIFGKKKKKHDNEIEKNIKISKKRIFIHSSGKGKSIIHKIRVPDYKKNKILPEIKK